MKSNIEINLNVLTHNLGVIKYYEKKV